MLAAHSQGAVLATAALVQPGCRPDGDHPALITFGSPDPAQRQHQGGQDRDDQADR